MCFKNLPIVERRLLYCVINILICANVNSSTQVFIHRVTLGLPGMNVSPSIHLFLHRVTLGLLGAIYYLLNGSSVFLCLDILSAHFNLLIQPCTLDK